jgi:ABC-type branched-subunit amino acid transport system permease subunit
MQVFLSQLTLGLVNGSFYAMLSLGLAVIFGLLGIVNFAHGALYMLGAYVAFIGMDSSASTTGPRSSSRRSSSARSASRSSGCSCATSTRSTRSTACCSPSAWR